MKKNLQDEVVGIKSSENDESFLNHIVVTEEFIAGVGWVVNVSFDEKFMHRNSLYQEKYPDGVLLNEIFNEGYNAKDYVYGIWHENNIRSRKQRDALYFIQQAVENFNSKYKGKAVALYNRKYSGGTL